MLARAFERTKQTEKAREVYQRGAEVASAHGHPSMAEEYKNILESEFSVP
jgi:hypothetical protein